MAYQCKSPILFLVFNRPDSTKRVFEAIRSAQPTVLYVAADGPRAERDGEKELCQKVREIATNVDWDCTVKPLFRDQNLGCAQAVSEAITWFFDHVEEGIILEDDCLPHVSFFEYCDFMLETCRKNEEIWSVAGTKFKCYPYSRNSLGYKSEVFFCWGWATWRDRWFSYKSNVDELLPIERFSSSKASEYWNRAIKALENKSVDSWAYKYSLMSIKNSKKNLVPPCNLVRNIGFNKFSTHTAVQPRHCSNSIVPFVLKGRKGYSKVRVFDDIYYGQFHKKRWSRCMYYMIMYLISFSEKNFPKGHVKLL